MTWLGRARQVGAKRWPPRCVVSQIRCGSVTASRSSTSGRPRRAQQASRRAWVQTMISQGSYSHPAGHSPRPSAAIASATTLADAIAALGRGECPAGWEYEPWLIMVCTHARRDACCARLGRPLVDDLLAVTDPQRIWETTHLGGHRFAPTCLALPSQVIYGRVTSDRVSELAAAIQRGVVVPDLMRGRTTYVPALQVAEVAARTRLGIVDDTLELAGSSSDGDRTISTWRAGDATTEVTVEKQTGRPRQLSCGKDRLETRPAFVAV